MFETHLRRWGLTPDGAPILTPMGRLLPVRRDGAALMLKLVLDIEERRGAAVLAWWDGAGAARVLAHEEQDGAGALLMERATGTRSLAQMAREGGDAEAARILCAVAGRLHASSLRASSQPASSLHAARVGPPGDLVPMERWFAPLAPFAQARGGILTRCAAAAAQLLAAPRDSVVLHGDLHHDNVLDFGPRGWLAIDPKGLTGERGFDYANIFTNPDLADPTRPVATDPARFRERLAVVAEAAGLERERLLLWILAWTGLSAAWFAEDGDPAEIDLAVAAMAAAALDG